MSKQTTKVEHRDLSKRLRNLSKKTVSNSKRMRKNGQEDQILEDQLSDEEEGSQVLF